MQYQKASLGRVIIAKIEHGDDLLEELKNLLRAEQIQAGIMFMIGALEAGSLVVGPETCAVPPEPVWKEFSDGREVLGIGTVFTEDGDPVIHLHSSLGRGDEALTGCIRKDSRVYLVVEVILMEFLDSGAVRTLDSHTGLNLLGFA